jgi:hypothetical protein
MMTKTLKFVSCIILFFSLFLTAKTIYNHYPESYTKCEDYKDCHDALVGKEKELLTTNGRQVMCMNGFCHMVIRY